MLIFCTALHCEAAPLIKHYELKRCGDISAFEAFTKEDIFLIVSKPGRVRAAAAISFAAARLKKTSGAAVINLGICGAQNKFEIGTILLANKVSTTSSRRVFYPDILLRHKFKEAYLETFDVAVTCADDTKADCVDMEAHGFLESASIFFNSTQAHCIKIVSDHFNISTLDPHKVSSLIEDRIDTIATFAHSLEEMQHSSFSPLSAQDEDAIKKLANSLRLSRYQTFALSKLACGYRIRGAVDLDILSDFYKLKPQSKAEVNAIFSRMQDALLSA